MKSDESQYQSYNYYLH